MEWLLMTGSVMVKTSAVLLTTLLVNTIVLRRSSAALRHAVWVVGIVATIAVPAFTIVIPAWHVPLLQLPAREAPRTATPLSQTAATIPATPVARETSGPSASDVPAVASTAAQSRRRSDLQAASHLPPAARVIVDWPRLLLLIWLAGAVLLLARQAVAFVRTAWLVRRADEHAPWLPIAKRLAAESGASANTRLLSSERLDMPMACGLLRPAIVVPATADAWPAERLRIVLLHELAHVRRRDCLTQAAADFACAVYWPNPLTWVAARHLRREREHACDDAVLSSGTEGADYADHLLAIARAAGPPRGPLVFSGGLAMAHRSELEGRLMAILDANLPRRSVTARALMLTATVACLAAAPLAALTPWAIDETGTHNQSSGASTTTTPTPAPDVVRSALPTPMPMPTPTPTPTPSATPTPTPTPTPMPHIEVDVAEVSRATSAALSDSVVSGIVEAFGGSVASVAGAIAGAVQEGKPVVAGGSDREKAARPADPRIVGALSEAIKDPDAQVRQAALQAIARLRDPATFNVLATALRDKEPEVRQQAAHALGQLGDRRALEALAAAIDDTDAEVRQQAIFALGQLRDPSSGDVLLKALKDADEEVRQQAAFALGQLRDKRAVPSLVAALADADEEVRQQAVFALGQIRDPGSVEALIKAVADKDSEVRQQALFALSQIGDPRATDVAMAALQDPDPEVRQSAAHALSQLLHKP
jgi:HEAT repeat protein/beta-lactamase regulating signal transducer with metallopeptidase domain